jgi:peptidoglycan/xylan/chitin deacetylase (PgdA/CDA1 family)
MLNALSFDIEEWFHLLDTSNLLDSCHWDSLPQIVEHYTYEILEILAQFDVRATFFIVGWVANKHPKLVQEIADLGHEVASHSYWHTSIKQMHRWQFEEDLHHKILADLQPK